MSHLGGIDLTTLGPPANRADVKANANTFHFNFQNPFKSKPALDLTNSVEGEGTHDQVENLETAEVVPQPGHLAVEKILEEEPVLQIPRGEISAEEAGNVAILAGVGNSVGIKDMVVDENKEESLDSNNQSEEESDGESEEFEEIQDIPAQ